jgi:tRNA splicing ligase
MKTLTFHQNYNSWSSDDQKINQKMLDDLIDLTAICYDEDGFYFSHLLDDKEIEDITNSYYPNVKFKIVFDEFSS